MRIRLRDTKEINELTRVLSSYEDKKYSIQGHLVFLDGSWWFVVDRIERVV